MSQQDVVAEELSDEQMLAISAGEWALPNVGNGICDRWRDAFICVRLQDVLARRFFDTPYARLSVEDRTRLAMRVEHFLERMAFEFDANHIDQVIR